MAALLDVDLEQVAQVVEARRREAQAALLLDGGRLGVALDDDQALQVGAVLAGDLLPRPFALVLRIVEPAAYGTDFTELVADVSEVAFQPAG